MYRPFLQMVTTGGNEVPTDGEPVETTLSIMDLILSGGIGGISIMVILFILAIIAVYIYIERFSAIKTANKIEANFMNNIKDHVSNGKLESAKALCDSQDSPVSRMIGKGIDRIGKPVNDISASVENQGLCISTSLSHVLDLHFQRETYIELSYLVLLEW